MHFSYNFLFMNFSVLFSCTRFRKNEFFTFCFKYLLNGYFAFGISDARLQSILTKKLGKASGMNFLFVVVIPFNVNEFGKILAVAFKATIDLIPSQVFFNVCAIFLKIVLIILFFGFF